MTTESVPEVGPVAPKTLPVRVEVAIVGGGLAGLSCATALAEHGVRVAVLESRAADSPGDAARACGILLPGPTESAHRLVDTLGEEECALLFGLARRSAKRLESLELFEPTGVSLVALSQEEQDSLESDLVAYQALGWKAEPWTPSELQISRGLRSGCHLPDAGVVDTHRAISRLRKAVTNAGGDLFFSTTVLDVEDEDHGVSVLTNQGRIEAELLVHTAGWNLTEYLPWSRDKLYPVRLQHLKARSTDIQLSGPMVLQYGHSWARPLGDGKISTGGCRWATPHLEIGENDDEHTSEVVESKILNRAHALFSPDRELDISERWAQIATFTCDGLPFVGTLPGTARQLVCTGWNARPWSMALAAGEMVASAICDESSDELPRCIGSYRMI